MRASVPAFSARSRRIAIVAALIVVLLALFGVLINIYADVLWYRSVGYSSVYGKLLATKLLLFGLFGGLMTLIVGANLAIAYRVRPVFTPVSVEQQSLDRYRAILEPRLRLLLFGVSGFIGLLAGVSAAGRWQQWLLFFHAQSFGEKDPQFHKDIGYYVFTYPFQRFLLSFFFLAVVLSLLGALIVHYFYGGVRIQPAGERITLAARAHLSVLLGVFVLLKAAAYWLDRYGLVFSSRSAAKINGASYTDLHAVLPAKLILLFVAVFCAVAFFANVVVRNLMLPGIALCLLILSAMLIGGVYPAAFEQFTVKPSANVKEATYIGRNIEATRKSYDLKQTVADTRHYQANSDPTNPQTVSTVATDTATLPNIRLLDPNVLHNTFTNLEQNQNFYGFDRYTVDGKTQDYVVAARELDSSELTGPQKNWINRHMTYTHGYGLVAAPANSPLDSPSDFVAGDFNEQSKIKVTRPQIYFGELATDYAIVGNQKEFDRPSKSGDQLRSTYQGKGGISLGSFTNRLTYALYFRERNLLLSGQITKKSRLLYERDPRDRVHKVAPFLTLDGDPYPAVVNGKIVWIVDGYTTSNNYPYAQRRTLESATADSLTGQGKAGQPQRKINYIRNSVKATVDAYTGNVTLYAFDETDPVLKAWQSAFPHLIKPASAISSQLRDHLRYPEDLFKVQRDVLREYHVSDPQSFFTQGTFWRVPDDPDPKKSDHNPQPPYYLVMQQPGGTDTSFRLTTVLNARNNKNLGAFVSVSSDPATYGQWQVLELPGGTPILGPNQVQNKFNTDNAISTKLSLLDQHGSTVVYGNLLTLPVAGGLLYVEPVYLESESGKGYPQLSLVLASYGDKAVFGDTLCDALKGLFGTCGNVPANGQNSGTTTTTPGSAAVDKAVTDLQTAVDKLQQAYKDGDFTKIGQATADLQTAIKEYQDARKGTQSSPSPSTSGGPTPSPSATPKPSVTPTTSASTAPGPSP
jgi:uncharacterized membrane protein (UPF0182 family)